MKEQLNELLSKETLSIWDKLAELVRKIGSCRIDKFTFRRKNSNLV